MREIPTGSSGQSEPRLLSKKSRYRHICSCIFRIYEPELNPTYHEMATHYGVAIVPARARKPKDKAKAEVGVQVVERWILAALRNRQFFSLVELNQAIASLLIRLNQRPFRKLR